MSDCCSTPAGREPSPRSVVAHLLCPQCQQPGKAVSLLTLKHQVKPPHLMFVEEGPFAFCRSRECLVVYFNATGGALTLNDVRQRPTAKGGENPQLCYCFGFDTEMVRAEIAATGDCTIPQRIAAEMKADRCACEMRNPQGSCCMANITAAVKKERSALRSRGSSS